MRSEIAKITDDYQTTNQIMFVRHADSGAKTTPVSVAGHYVPVLSVELRSASTGGKRSPYLLSCNCRCLEEGIQEDVVFTYTAQYVVI